MCAAEAQDSELPADKHILFITIVRSASHHHHCPYYIIAYTAIDISKYSRKLRGSRVGSKQER